MQCMNKCEQCGKDYEAKRATSRFCSAKCRKLAFQQNGKVSVPDDKPVSVPIAVIPKIQNTPEFTILNYGLPGCMCQHCQNNRATGNKHTLNHGAFKPFSELGYNELNRVSLLGDVDYKGVVQLTAYS